MKVKEYSFSALKFNKKSIQKCFEGCKCLIFIYFRAPLRDMRQTGTIRLCLELD